jgi:hypothetical protein
MLRSQLTRQRLLALRHSAANPISCMDTNRLMAKDRAIPPWEFLLPSSASEASNTNSPKAAAALEAEEAGRRDRVRPQIQPENKDADPRRSRSTSRRTPGVGRAGRSEAQMERPTSIRGADSQARAKDGDKQRVTISAHKVGSWARKRMGRGAKGERRKAKGERREARVVGSV